MVPFGEWRPDIANLDTPFLIEARNVIPSANSYGPHPSMAAYSTAQLPSRAIGFCMARKADGNWSVFAGTASHLYRFNSTNNTWDQISRTSGGAYSASAEIGWSFAQFGTKLVAVNGADVPQVFDVDVGTAFAALGGSPPVARNVAVVGDFLVLSNLVGLPRRVAWSAINDITNWTQGSMLSDVQDFPDGGNVMSVAGGEVGYVLQDYAIRRMVFQPGSDYTFDFKRIEAAKGSVSLHGATSVFGTLYFLSEDGFYAIRPEGVMPIGGQRVNNWFKSNTDKARIQQTICYSDPHRPRVSWAAYKSPSSAYYDLVITYDWLLDRWSSADIVFQWLGAAATPGATLEGMDALGRLEELTIPFDSRVWAGGRPVLASCDANGRLAFIEGPFLPARLQTAEFHAMPGKRAKITSLYPFVDTATAAFTINAKERRSDSWRAKAMSPVQVNGTCPGIIGGKIFSVACDIPADTVWQHAQGFDLDMVGDGDR